MGGAAAVRGGGGGFGGEGVGRRGRVVAGGGGLGGEREGELHGVVGGLEENEEAEMKVVARDSNCFSPARTGSPFVFEPQGLKLIKYNKNNKNFTFL